MKLVELIKDILNEGKRVGNLYHFTNEESLDKILSDDKLLGSFMYEVGDAELRGVSTSRNKNLNYDRERNNIRITLDGDMISNNYKIKPRDYWERVYNVPDNPQTIDEIASWCIIILYEEIDHAFCRIQVGHLKNDACIF